MFKYIPRTVWILSLVSLFTDIASEMLYPIMPLYLQSLGYTTVFIGVLEGVVEGFSGYTKGYFGKLSDLTAKRLPFVQAGYTLSGIAKSLIGIFTQPFFIFTFRWMDRLGKGLRSSARDAMLADVSTDKNSSTIFGFHRSMDTLGAVIGPGLALLFLSIDPNNYQLLFLLAFIPSLISIGCTFIMKEQPAHPPVREKINFINYFFSFSNYWKKSSSSYKQVTIGLLAFALINSSDFFLLLKLKENNISTTSILLIYMLFNLSYALSAYPIGIIADRIGRIPILIIGILIFSMVYFSLSFQLSTITSIAAFLLYGIFYACTDSIAKSILSLNCAPHDKGIALGFFGSYQSLMIIIANTSIGFALTTFPFQLVLQVIAGIGILIAAYFMVIYRRKKTF